MMSEPLGATMAGVAGTSAEYEWISTWMNGLLEKAYCLSVVRDLTADEILDRLGADGGWRRRGSSAQPGAA